MSVSAELARVRLEPRRDQDDRSDDSSIAESEDESVPSADDNEGDYDVDAIKWARYKTRDDAGTRWYYGVIWNGYLKTGSETEEPISSFTVTPGQPNLIREFWQAIGKTTGRGRREPEGRMNEFYETPPECLKRWFHENRTRKNGLNYKRNYETYKRRRAKELKREQLEKEGKEIPSDLWTKKADSDYYLFKRQLRARRRQQRATGAVNGDRPTTSARSSRSITPATSRASTTRPRTAPYHATATSTAPAPAPPATTSSGNAVVSLGSPASEFGSEFNSDREGVEEELRAESSDNDDQPPKASSSKRKAPFESPVGSTSTSQANHQVKKARTEETTSRLAKVGKIAKRVLSPPPSASEVTFGALQDGIFELNPGASTSSSGPSSSTAPVSAVPAPMPTIQATSAVDSPALTARSINNPASTSSAPIAPPPQPISAIKAALLRLEAEKAEVPRKASMTASIAQAVSSSPIVPQEKPSSPTLDRTSASAQTTPPLTSVNQPAPAPKSAALPHKPLTPSASSSGPVPNFNPKPVAGSSKARLPLPEKPKYVQPKKIQVIDDVVDPRAGRQAKTNVDDGGRHRPPPLNNTAPQRSSAFVPRTANQNQQNANHQNQSLNGASVRSPIVDQSPTLSNITQSALPTPATTPIQGTKDSAPINFPLNPIDGQGGLVTFSPQLILRSPGKFVNVMKFCMTNPHWAAYFTPAAMEFINSGWSNRQLCPDATQAFSVLVQFLPLDGLLRDLAGAGITSGGGLSISCCPPNPYQADDCIKWKTWLHDVCATTDYQELVTLCEKYNQKLGPTFPMVIKEADLGKIELLQIDDMKNIKARHLTDHTRFVYVTPERKPSPTEAVEYISVDDFINLLASGD
ncbi:hypothetical protein I203_100146 [Kwoniella mangroviensis CBS 8507]|uniref:uncharacterized protein n=1 Tax=Kwoniella mangroviensis CBS 8507 TaxID=1296122 RepID=UPI00080CC1B8|nr:uncharacterized protein I203_08051 [Kwoniella mangroviensis CBS 8507]OCF62828.1 hypothetical protein I203_08051 [Kwoniella mangroviensis CBS 8507]